MKISKENYECLCGIARALQEDYDNDSLNMNAMDLWYNLNSIINEIVEDNEELEDNKATLKSYVEDTISCYDSEYQKELKMLDLDNEDIDNICFEILNNHTIQYEIQQEIEDYCNFKNQD